MGTSFFLRSRRSTNTDSTTASSGASPPSSERRADDRYAVRMPINDTADSVEEAARALQKCSPEELRRARRHHRRALEALQEGCYDALDDDTRLTLVQRLKADLTALNEAIDTAACGAMNATNDSNARMSVTG